MQSHKQVATKMVSKHLKIFENHLKCIGNEILTSFFSEFEQFIWFIKNLRHFRENLIVVKSFFTA